MNLSEILQWRYAVKKYSDRKVSEDKIQHIVEAINLSASSTGLQPYRLIVVDDKKIQAELGEGSFNAQITEASHLIVFAAFDNVHGQQIENFIDRVAQVREIPREAVADYEEKLKFYLLNRTPEENFNWASRQAYIGLGTALIAAADQQVDSTPMEGFDAEKFDRVLGLTEKGLKSVVVLALGYRDAEKDAFSSLKKVRIETDDLIIHV